ncbi:L,D-transpeptidase family protein [Rhizobium sp. NFR07]|uniref:L,D-transpeptidase family protein n=1 Tax=Rhizobium sp. NFR07 TaxID=1566262 RepID=UPI001FCCD412|nr:L,D-transpeptidase family protein [Rhizobium sp. NFR07]
MQHTSKKTTLALALLSGFSIFAGATAPAHAISLRDLLMGGPGKRDGGSQAGRGRDEAMPSERALADPEPLPKVSGPRYYTYKADAQRLVKTGGFAAAEPFRSISEAKVSSPSDIAQALESYYATASQPIWVSADDINEKARAVLALFERAGDYGLDPADYMLAAPTLTTASVEPAPTAEPVAAPATGPAETVAPVAAADAVPAATADAVEGDVPAADAAATAVAPDASSAPTATPIAGSEMPAAPAEQAAAPATDAAPVENAAPAQPEVPAVAQPEVQSAATVARQQELMQFELALSQKALLFAQDMVRGRVDPNRISGYHDLKRKAVDLTATLAAISQGEQASAYLEGLAPKSANFQSLKNELATLKAEAVNAGDDIVLPDTLLLKPGNSSTDLPQIVAVIEKKGSESLKSEHAATLTAYQKTPEYTPELVELVKSYQSEVGLKADGVIGAATLRKMAGHTPQDRIGKLVVAMEQARWMPDDLGQRYVFINQPAFRVYYHDHGAEQFSMRVVIGSKAHQTFFFNDQIQTVEFNPYWGVPQSIIINEMLPKLRQDPSYLDRTGYEVAVNGRVMPSSSVNWYGSTSNISVRQPPSSDNALGDLKILFPNAHAIYMHDTPSKSFFQRDMRALSHGCVRLAEPRKMAAAVLGVSERDVDAEIAAGKNVAEKVTANIPVYVSYFTAWPNKDGAVEYFDDVYDRDTAVEKAFDTTTKARSARS